MIEADLQQASRLNLADYTVLANLSEQPGRTMRMTDLAGGAAMSASGVTRVVVVTTGAEKLFSDALGIPDEATESTLERQLKLCGFRRRQKQDK